MKFHKGNLVEVLRREHDPCGSWYPASIVSSDGDNLIVRFKFLIDNEGQRVVEKVWKRDVRPRPLHVKKQTWAVGDMVEVFDAKCWRVGKVGKVLQKTNRVVIRFFGSIQLKEFDISCLRIRQVWCDNEWKMIGKVIQENFRGAHIGGSRKKRRSSHSFRGRDNAVYNYRRPSQSTEDSDQCSVASCSSNGMDDYRALISRRRLENSREDSDAESSFPSTYDRRYLAREERPEPDIHELELHAYKSTLEAMYALGPLSWDQESLLTNLRVFLHISDEEHLFQLKYLLSSQVL